MDPNLAAKFLEHGIVGVCVIALAYVVWRLYRSYNELQNKRVDEAKAVTDRIVSLSEEWLTALGELSKMVEKHSDNVTSLRDECRERTDGISLMIRDMIRDLRTYVDELHRRNADRGGGGS